MLFFVEVKTITLESLKGPSNGHLHNFFFNTTLHILSKQNWIRCAQCVAPAIERRDFAEEFDLLFLKGDSLSLSEVALTRPGDVSREIEIILAWNGAHLFP